MPSTMNTETAFAQFSTSISYMIFYRFLALICLILVMGSYIMLCSWYTLITGSKILEEYMEDIYSNINFPNFNILITNAGEYLTQKINKMSSFDKFKSNFEDVNIKKEKMPNDPLYTSHYDISDDNHSKDDDEVDDYDSDSSSDLSNFVPSDSDYEEDDDNEVEDITHEYLAEKERNKITIDLTCENDENDENDDENDENDENDDDDDNDDDDVLVEVVPSDSIVEKSSGHIEYHHPFNKNNILDNHDDEDSLPALISDSDEELEDIRDIMQDRADDRRESRREGRR